MMRRLIDHGDLTGLGAYLLGMAGVGLALIAIGLWA